MVPQKEAGMAVLSSLSTNEIVTSTPFPPQTSVSEPVHPVVQPIHSQQQLPPRTETSVPFIPSNGVTSPTYSGMHTTPQPSFNLREAQYMTPGKNQPLNSTTDQLSVDSASLLKRVSVPKFSGNKKNYEAWKAAFYSCFDQARATPECKLLRMRDCLHGEALKVVENLGHSAAAYEAAKIRLERKYGGARRALTLRLEELDAFKPIREGDEKDLEGFAELLDAIVVNLKDAGQEAELGSGFLYITLQRKFNRNLLTKYKQWISDKCQNENVATLRVFIDRESEFLTTASETISGVLKESTKKERNLSGRTFVTQDNNVPKKRQPRKCKVCGQSHGIWACDNYNKMTVNHRWDIAKEHKLCFRCLGEGHRGETCSRSRACGINGCKSSHHRMLHGDKVVVQQSRVTLVDQENEREERYPQNPSGSETHVNEVNQSPTSTNTTLTTTMAKKPAVPLEFVALRTVPVYLINGTKRVKVNALLDEASSKSYLNSDVAAELGLEGEPC